MIGRVAGASVKTLPSVIYWAALGRYGVLTRDVAPEMLGALSPAATGDDELTLHSTQDWHPTLPEPPAGFPDTIEGGMVLRPEESVWLRERILETTPGTMLAHLLTDDTALVEGDTFPWDEPACLSAGEGPSTLLRHGRLFSLAIEGAALTYNLLIAERYEAAGKVTIEHPVDRYRDALTTWAEDVQSHGALLRGWDRQELWDLVRGLNPRIGLQTRTFVNAWLDVVIDGHGATAAEDPEIRSLVELRERHQKKAQSRLENDKLLRSWSGASGTSRLICRWPQVKRMVTDISEGAAGAGA